MIRAGVLCAILLSASSLHQSCIHVADLAGYQKVSSVYKITTKDGVSIPVEQYQDYHVARLSASCDSSFDINISVAAEISSFVVSPLSKKYKSSLDASTGQVLLQLPKLTMPDAHYIILKVNHDIPFLALLVDSWNPTLDEFRPGGRPVLDVSKPPYAADITGQQEATKAIQAALDDSKRGDVVYIPAGTFLLTHTLNWSASSEGVELFLAPGSVLRTTPDRSQLTWNKKSSCLTLEPMLKLKGPSHIAIRGRGTFDASGLALMARPPAEKKSKTCTWAYRRRLIDSDYRKSSLVFGRRRRKSGVRPQNVTIEGVTLKDATTWTVVVEAVQHLLIQNVKVLNHKNSTVAKIQNDGLDLCANADSVVRKNFVITQDDAMCLKASRSPGEFPYNTTVVNNTFEGNVVWTACAGAKFGMQARNIVRDSVFRDHDVIHARRGIVVEATSGAVKMGPGLLFEDVRIEELTPTVVEDTGSAKPMQPITVNAQTAAIEGVVARAVHFDQPARGIGDSSIDGKAAGGVRDVSFVNLRFGGVLCNDSQEAGISQTGAVADIRFRASASSDTII